MAGLPEEERAAVRARADLKPLTPSTITSVDELRAEIDRVREAGFAIVDQELEVGLCSVAVPIHNTAGDVVAAINLSTHATRASRDEIEARLLPPLRATADRIERDLR